MKPLNFKFQYFTLFFIFLFISIGSVAATEDFLTDDGESSHIRVCSVNSINNFKESNIKGVHENFSNNSLSVKGNSKESIRIFKNPKDEENCICSVSASTTTKTIISSKSLSIDYGANGYVVGYLKTSSGKSIKSKKVKMTLNSQNWSKITDSNGKFSFKIPLLNPSTYSVKLSFSTESGYSASSCLINVTVKKISTKILSSNLYAYDDNNLVAYIKDNKNNPLKDKLVKFTINGNSFNAFSDSNGQINFNIPSYLKAKNYSSTIKFIGDKYYSSSTTSVKIYKFDNSNIESFINELVISKEFKQFSNTSSKNLNQSLQNTSNLSFNQLLDNLTKEELKSINQFLNLISSNNLNNFKDDSNLAISTSNGKTDTNIVESLWKWLNTPILEIPGYSDLDKKYGVLGQSLKLAGWFLLGIDDKGGLTPLDIGLDALSICSGAGFAERIGISSSSLVLKVADKFPIINNLLKSSIKIKGLDYAITVKTIFNAYKSSLSLLNNPIKFVSSKVITNVLDKWNSKIASFTVGYISNSFLTLSSVLGIGEVYVNSKDNALFTTKILSNISSVNSIKVIINGSTSPIASTLKNIKKTTDSISNTIKDVSKTIDKTVSSIKNTVTSTVNKVKTAIKDTSKTVAKTASKITNTVKKASNVVKSKVSNVVKNVNKSVNKVANKVKTTANKAVKAVKKTVKKTTKATKKVVNKVANKVKTTANKAVKAVKKTVKKTTKAVKKTVKKVTRTVKKVTNTVKKTVNKVANKVKNTVSSISTAFKKLW